MGIPLESNKGSTGSFSPEEPKLSRSSRQREEKPNRRSQRSNRRVTTEAIGYYLSSIGRVPLLTPAEEIELAKHVQDMKKLADIANEERTPRQKHQIRMGKRARDRMMAANLRLVVSVAKKYQNQHLKIKSNSWSNYTTPTAFKT